MSAREVIHLIEALPPDERGKVVEFVRSLDTSSAQAIRYMDEEKAEEVASRVFEEHAELFRKLAQ